MLSSYPVRSSLLITLAFALTSPISSAQSKGEGKLEKAIKTLRNVHPEKLSEKQQQAMSGDMEDALKAIRVMGNIGLARLKKEVEVIEKSGQKDDYFKLIAAHLAWSMGTIGQVDFITHIWETTPLDYQYHLVFLPAFEAAGTQNKNVLPMLRALLKDEKGEYLVENHMMQLKWPLTLEFVWGRMGSVGLPALLEILKTSRDPVEIKSAVILLGESHYLPALPELRRIAKSDIPGAKEFAIEWIGDFGHPNDFQFLIQGLGSNDETRRAAYRMGILAFEDLRAAKYFIPLLDSKDERSRQSACRNLELLVSPDSLLALHNYSKKSDEKENVDEGKWADKFMQFIGMTWDEFLKKPAEEQSKLVRNADPWEKEFQLRKEDRKLSHKDLLRALSDWKKAHRITGGEFEWVGSRHILSAAKPSDLDAIVDVRAAVYGRLSDECLYEVQKLNPVIRRVGRSRYRKNVGVCERAEPLEETANPATTSQP
jgi:hypothetical protein